MGCKRDRLDWLMSFGLWSIVAAMVAAIVWGLGWLHQSKETCEWASIGFVVSCVAVFTCATLLGEEIRNLPDTTSSHDDVREIT